MRSSNARWIHQRTRIIIAWGNSNCIKIRWAPKKTCKPTSRIILITSNPCTRAWMQGRDHRIYRAYLRIKLGILVPYPTTALIRSSWILNECPSVKGIFESQRWWNSGSTTWKISKTQSWCRIRTQPCIKPQKTPQIIFHEKNFKYLLVMWRFCIHLPIRSDKLEQIITSLIWRQTLNLINKSIWESPRRQEQCLSGLFRPTRTRFVL